VYTQSAYTGPVTNTICCPTSLKYHTADKHENLTQTHCTDCRPTSPIKSMKDECQVGKQQSYRFDLAGGSNMLLSAFRAYALTLSHLRKHQLNVFVLFSSSILSFRGHNGINYD